MSTEAALNLSEGRFKSIGRNWSGSLLRFASSASRAFWSKCSSTNSSWLKYQRISTKLVAGEFLQPNE